MSETCIWCGNPIREGQYQRVPNGWACGLRCKQEYENNRYGNSSSGGSGSGGCFIATSVYGSYDHPIVLDLRSFRDNWLDKRELGKIIIRWYYHRGPILASWIDKSKSKKFIVLCFIVKPLHFFVKTLGLNK
jgi:hypothetical protein